MKDDKPKTVAKPKKPTIKVIKKEITPISYKLRIKIPKSDDGGRDFSKYEVGDKVQLTPEEHLELLEYFK